MSSDNLKTRSQSQFGAATECYATSEVHAAGESLGILTGFIPTEASWNMLDVATGAGHTSFAFAKIVRSIIATDITLEMLKKTAELAVKRGHENIKTVFADAENLPFENGSFDLVTCRLAHHHFPNQQRAIDEITRVLKSGGWFGFTDNYTVEIPTAASYYNEYERLRDPSHHIVHPLAAIRSMVMKAGLHIEKQREICKEFEFQEWANRQNVVENDKKRLLQMMRDMPPELKRNFRPRWANNTMYFTLWETVIAACKR